MRTSCAFASLSAGPVDRGPKFVVRPPAASSPSLRVVTGAEAGAGVAPPADDFARLVGLVKSNERLFAEQRANRARLEQVRGYLARPDANVALGRALLERLRARRSAVLALLRANRAEARALLARVEAAPRG